MIAVQRVPYIAPREHCQRTRPQRLSALDGAIEKDIKLHCAALSTLYHDRVRPLHNANLNPERLDSNCQVSRRRRRAQVHSRRIWAIHSSKMPHGGFAA
eukprot:scaffold1220_cov259-Pinguiococcus_pyrenoidosus.AAC.27